MSSRTDENLGAVLTAIEDIAPEPPPFPKVSSSGQVRRHPLVVAAGAFVAVLIVVGVGAWALTRRAYDRPVATTTPIPPPTTMAEPGSKTPVAYVLGPSAEGWRIVAAREDRAGTRQTMLIDFTNGPADQEGVLPGVSIWVGPYAEEQMARIDAGTETVQWTFPLQGVEASVIASGTDAAGRDSGVVVWRTPQGEALWAEYDRLDRQQAQDLLRTVEPLSESEWECLAENTQDSSPLDQCR